MTRKALFSFGVLIITSVFALGSAAAASSDSPGKAIKSVVDRRLAGATGEIDIVVQLDDPPLALAHAENAKRTGNWLPHQQQLDHMGSLPMRTLTLRT